MKPSDFADKIRSKYPGAYDNVPDELLTKKIIEKYPEYEGKVVFQSAEPVESTEYPDRLSQAVEETANVRANKIKEISDANRSGEQGFARSAFQIGGQLVGGAIADPLVNVLKAYAPRLLEGIGSEVEEIKQNLTKGEGLAGELVVWLSDNKKFQEFAMSDKAKPLERDIEAINEYLALFAPEKAGAGIKSTIPKVLDPGVNIIEKGKDAAKTVVQAVKDPKQLLKDAAVLRYGKDAEVAVGALEKSYSDIPLPKNITRAQAETGRSFARFMAEKPYVSIETKNMKYDTWATAQRLRAEAAVEAKAVRKLLESRVETISFDDVVTDMKSAITKKFSGMERESALKYVENEMEALKSQYSNPELVGPNGEMLMNLPTANDLKQTFWDRSPFNPTASRSDRLASSIDYEMGHTMKTSIEKSVPDVDVRALNSELGDYYNAIEILESLHGGAAPRGKIGVEFARIGGTIIGSQGGVVGSVIGYMGADQIVQFMSNPSFTTALKRYAVTELQKARPTVAQRVEELLVKQHGEQNSRLLLSEPDWIPMGPATPPPSGTIQPTKPGSLFNWLKNQEASQKAAGVKKPENFNSPTVGQTVDTNLIHYTKPSNIESIMEKGLLADKTKTGIRGKGNYFYPKDSPVQKYPSDDVALRVKPESMSKYDKQSFGGKTDEVEKEVLIQQNIKPGDLQIWKDGKWVDLIGEK
jgi:hypothetical protein